MVWACENSNVKKIVYGSKLYGHGNGHGRKRQTDRQSYRERDRQTVHSKRRKSKHWPSEITETARKPHTAGQSWHKDSRSLKREWNNGAEQQSTITHREYTIHSNKQRTTQREFAQSKVKVKVMPCTCPGIANMSQKTRDLVKTLLTHNSVLYSAEQRSVCQFLHDVQNVP